MKRRISSSVSYSCKYHVVWCSKYRRKVLTGEIAERLKELILQAANDVSADIINLEIEPDYVHLLLEVNPQIGINSAVRHVKGLTSHILRSEFPKLKSRLPTLWTNSYFVSTIGDDPFESIIKYIENQKKV